MFNLFDMMQAQNSANLQSFGQQFGLSPDQTRRALEALMPAFTIGMQRNAALDPTGFGRFFEMLGGASPAQRPQTAAPDPFAFMQLFASPALSQAVLQQAAAASGVGAQALRQMLPAMAGMVVAGIVHLMLNPPAPAPTASAPEPPGATLWAEWIKGFLPPATAPAAQPTETRARAGQTARPAGEAQPSFEAFQRMIKTGIDAQEQNVKAMHDIFDAFWTPPPQPAGQQSGRGEQGEKGSARHTAKGAPKPAAEPRNGTQPQERRAGRRPSDPDT